MNIYLFRPDLFILNHIFLRGNHGEINVKNKNVRGCGRFKTKKGAGYPEIRRTAPFIPDAPRQIGKGEKKAEDALRPLGKRGRKDVKKSET